MLLLPVAAARHFLRMPGAPCAIALCAALAVTLAAAPALARPMTAQDVAKLESVGEIAISPDGSRVAYTTVRLPDLAGKEKNGSAIAQLKLASGAEQGRDFLPADMDVSHIAFSPDGRQIGFIWRERDGKDAVWAIPVDGGGHRKIAEIPGANVTAFAWAPDGGTLYLLAEAEPDPSREAEQRTGFDAIVYEEEARFNRLFAARTGARPDATPRLLPAPGHVSAIKVTPDGRHLIVNSAPTPSVDDSFTSKRVHVLDAASGRTVRVIETPGKIDDVEISPDGRTLSLIAAADRHDPSPTTLHLVDIATGTIRALNAGAREAAMDAEWLQDGRLASIIHKGAQSAYRIYNADGSVSSEIATAPLSLGAIESGGGKVAVRADSAQHPGELFVWDGASFQRWTRHNPWLSAIEMGRQRLFTYKARDGQAIEGILIEPVGGVKHGGGPTILDVHGGPEAHESDGWNTNYGGPGQVAAGKGYAVFLPNYRGSTAYGVDFSRQHQADYAGKEFDDLVDAKQALVAAGITDPAHVGVTGGSYGGFATAWAATALSEHFAAGVMFVGLSNLVSKFGTTDIPNEMYLVHERKWPWEEWQHLTERSPIFHVGKARTPLLILHGQSDPRVDPGQSMELYRHIKTRTDTPVRLVLYPGEGHGNRKAAARLDYNLRMMEWFDRYLGKTGGKDGGKLPPPRPILPEGMAER